MSEAFADRIVLRLHHLGESFDPGAVSTPAFDGTQDGGFGMYIIEQSVDNVPRTTATSAGKTPSPWSRTATQPEQGARDGADDRKGR